MRLTKFFLGLLAGLILGAGLLLFGQVKLAERMRAEVESKFFLLRAIGYATFIFQGDDVQVALTIADLPEGAIEHSHRVAVTLLVVGALILFAVPWIRTKRR